MRKWWIAAAALLVVAGCSSESNKDKGTADLNVHAGHQMSAAQTDGAATQTADKADGHNAPAYTLDAKVKEDNGKYMLEVQTNLQLSKEHYGSAAVPGEGHIHFYLNDALIGPIQEMTPYELTALRKGTNKIRLVLAGNDHSESYSAVKELTFEVQ